jgi:osmoprotectant transport system permease protein
VCRDYLVDRWPEVQEALVEHVLLTLASIALGLAIAVPLALIARRYPRLETVLVSGSTILYTIPSLAMFSFLVPYTYLTARTVVIGLALYSLTILVRGMLAGLRSVPAEVVEAAIGAGYSRWRLLTRIELPLALPVVMAALRVATVSTVALTTVGSIVGYGGLGNLLLRGVDTQFKAQILTASVLCVVLAVVLDLALLAAQRAATPWVRARG